MVINMQILQQQIAQALKHTKELTFKYNEYNELVVEGFKGGSIYIEDFVELLYLMDVLEDLNQEEIK